MKRSIMIAIFIILISPMVCFAISVIPGAQGYGMSAEFGRGRHTVRYVTNTNSSGSGSFSQAIADHNYGSTPSVIVFETSGSINPSSQLRISRSELIIAGQTAPSPGIELRNTLYVRANEVLIQHIRFRPAKGGDGLVLRDEAGGGISNIVIDHCSFSWATDENLSISSVDDVNNVTIRHCLIAEALWPYYGFLSTSGSNDLPNNVLVYANLFGMNMDRNPLLAATNSIVLNNMVYGWGNRASHFEGRSQYSGTIKLSVVGNYYLNDPQIDSGYKKHPIWTYGIGTGSTQLNSGSEIFEENNDCNSDWNPCYAYSSGSNPYDHGNSDPVAWPSGLKDKIGDAGWTHSQLRKWVIDNAGARPKDRDTVDDDIIAKIETETGTQVYCVEYDSSNSNCNQVGEYAYSKRPAIAVRTHKLSVPVNPNGDSDGDGYTNLEGWLHDYAADVEGGGVSESSTQEPDPPKNLRIIN